tara:strand:+ start:229 stop:543 length:315 start_codon:yes stop_codon:yes gene_type:complete
MTHDGLWNEVKLSDQLKKIKKKLRETEGELSIIKGIGINSPEMKALQKRVKELEEIEKSHKKLNGELHKELELEKKNHEFTREDVQLKDIEIGRLMKKLQNKTV